MDRNQPQKVTYPKWAWALLIFTFAGMLGLLAYQARYITVQLDRQNRQLAQARDGTEIARATGRDVRPAAREIRPLIEELRPLARQGRPALRDTAELARELERFDAPRAIAAAGTLAMQLAEDERLARVLDRTERFLAEAERRGTLEDAGEVLTLVRDVRGVVHQSLSVQRRTLAIQEESIGVLKRSLTVQEASLEHLRRIDARTGGTRDP